MPAQAERKLGETLLTLLLKGGNVLDGKLARASFRLRVAFQLQDPFQLAINTIRPALTYSRSRGKRLFLPMLLAPEKSERLAVRWIVEAARSRRYLAGAPDMEQGIVDEVAAILGGTSKLYARRFNLHRNPN